MNKEEEVKEFNKPPYPSYLILHLLMLLFSPQTPCIGGERMKRFSSSSAPKTKRHFYLIFLFHYLLPFSTPQQTNIYWSRGV
ncbi:hypothetical protein PAMP_002595 [Pampus punctatissimus]